MAVNTDLRSGRVAVCPQPSLRLSSNWRRNFSGKTDNYCFNLFMQLFLSCSFQRQWLSAHGCNTWRSFIFTVHITEPLSGVYWIWGDENKALHAQWWWKWTEARRIWVVMWVVIDLSHVHNCKERLKDLRSYCSEMTDSQTENINILTQTTCDRTVSQVPSFPRWCSPSAVWWGVWFVSLRHSMQSPSWSVPGADVGFHLGGPVINDFWSWWPNEPAARPSLGWSSWQLLSSLSSSGNFYRRNTFMI